MAEDISSLQIRVESDGVKNASGELKIFIIQSEKAERATEKLKRESSSLNGVLDGLKARTAALGLSTAALGAAVIKTTHDWLAYDKAMKEVASISTGTRKEMMALRGDVLKLASAVGVDATVAAKGLYQALSAGVPKENAFRFLETASKTAVAGVTSVDVAVDGLTNVINAWKLNVADAEQVADRLFMAVVDGKTTFEEISRNISKASVPAAALGIQLEELLSWLVATTAQGTPTSEAFTQLKATITALQDPSDELLLVYRQLGVESGRQAIAQFGLQGVLQKVTEAYRGNDAALVKALRSSEAFNGVLSVTGDNAELSARSLDRLKGASGNMADAYATNSATLENSLNTLKASAIGLVETMEGSLGVIAKFSEALKGAALMIETVRGMELNYATTRQALQEGLGGGFAGSQMLKQISDLEAAEKRLKDAGATIEGHSVPLLNYTTRSGSANLELRAVTEDLKALREAYDKLGESDKAIANITHEANAYKEALKTATDPAEIADYQARLESLRESYAEVTGEVTRATQERQAAETTAADAKAKKDKEAEARAKNALKLAAEQEESAKQEAAQLKETLELAKDLSTTEREKLEAKKASIQATIDGGKLDEETGKKALAALDAEIAALDERNAKKAGGGGAGGDSPKGFGSLAAEYDLPELHKSSMVQEDGLLERLAEEEQRLHESYEKRRQAIVDSEKLTGEQKIAAMRETEAQYMTELQKYQEAQNDAYLQHASDFFGNLSTIASAFGKKGQKAAKGFAIAQATVDTYSSAVAAYKSMAGIPYVGPALGVVAGAAAIAAGMANIQKIRSTEYSGAYALGGNIPAGSFGLVGEAGPELVRGPAMVTSAHATRERMGGSSAPVITNVVHNYAGVDVQTEARQTPDGRTELTTIVRHVRNELAKDIRTGGNKFASAFEETFQIPRGKR